MIKDRVSVVIPIYEDAERLETCIHSVLSQTYAEIEVLCVDDCSGDGSYEILLEAGREDARLNVFRMEENSGPLMARKKGVEEAAGQYILFLDADDWIDKGLLEELMREEQKEPADILHFSTEVINCGVQPAYFEGTKKFVAPRLGRFWKNEISKCFFEEDLRGWHLWGKLYDSRICKKVFRNLKGNYRNAEDLFAFYLIVLCSDRYRGVETENKYVYHLGNGLIGTNEIGLEKFKVFCQASGVYDSIEKGCENLGLFGQEQKNLKQIKRRLIFDNVWVFWNRLAEDCKRQGILLLYQAWSKEREVLQEALKELSYGDYFTTKIEKLAQITKEKHLQILLYPYGIMGRRVERELRERGNICAEKADQRVGGEDGDVLFIEKLPDSLRENYLCVICSNRREIYDEIRKTASCFFTGERICDFFPEEEQRYIWGEDYGR